MASSSVSLERTLRFMWKPPCPKYMSKAFTAFSIEASASRRAMVGATETV